MADEAFNQPVQTEQPGNYIYWSRPIQEPKANLSSEIALKGAGDVAKGASELFIKGEESGIRNDIYQKTDQLKDDYIQRLSKADSLIGGDASAVDQPPKNGPKQLQALPGTLDTLTAARENGKMSETYYMQQMYNLAKQYRTNNPLFRNYIDQQFDARMKTGVANDLIKSLTADINTYAANARESRNRMETIISHAAVDGQLGPNGGKIFMAWKKGDMQDGPVMDMIAKAGARKYNDEAYLLSLRVEEAKATFDERKNKEVLGPLVASQIQTYTDAQLIPVNGDTMSLRDIARKAISGDIKLDPTKVGQLTQVAKQQRDDIYNKVWSDITNVDKNGNSVLKSTYGGDPIKAKADLEASMAPMDAIVKMYENGDLASAKIAEATVKDMTVRSELNLYNDPYMRQYLLTAKGLSMIAGNSPAFAGWQMVAQPSGDMMNHLKGLYTKELTGIAAQSTGDEQAPNVGDSLRMGKPITLNDAIERAKQAGVSGPSGARVYRGWMESLAVGLSDKKMPYPVKVNLVGGTYGGSNKDLMFHFNPDTTDDKGNRVPGSTSAFTTLVNKKITDNVKLLGDPILEVNASWEGYKETGIKWFGDTYHHNIEELNRVSDIIKGGQSDLKLTWDDQNVRWDIHQGPYKGAPSEYLNRRTQDNIYFERAKNAVENFNRGIEAIKTIAAKDPSVDVKALISKMMVDQGLQPSMLGVLTQKLIKTYMEANRGQAQQ